MLIGRLLAAVVGNAGVSLVGLAAGLLLLKEGGADAFGAFALFQTVVALGFGVSNALFGAPLAIALTEAEDGIGNFDRANLLFCSAGSAGVVATMLALDIQVGDAVAVGVAAFLQWHRWYEKSVCVAAQEFRRATWSDALYSVAAIVGLLACASRATTLGSVSVALAVATAVSLVARGGTGVRRVRRSSRLASFSSHFKRHGRAALAGVLSTEATTNAHAYIVVALLGPAAFAPIAAVQLLFRPVGVALGALAQFERSRLARRESVGSEPLGDVLRVFILVVGVGYVANVVFAYVLAHGYPAVLGFEKFDAGDLTLALNLSALVVMMRVLRSPISVVMQATGDFWRLTKATLVSSCVALPAVLLSSVLGGASASLAGVLVGEIACFSLLVHFRAARPGPLVGAT